MLYLDDLTVWTKGATTTDRRTLISLALTSVGALATVSANLTTTTPLTFAAAASTNSTTQAPVTMPVPPAVLAKSVVLMNADNGQILYQKDPNERRAPASTTKLMTMLLIMKAIQEHKVSWTDIVPVTPDAYAVAQERGVSDAYLDPTEHFTLREMMGFISVLSANDATIAVADDLGGDQQGFVAMMNAEARKLDLTGTHYSNADGLPAADHYTTALDLATLARHLVKDYPQTLQFTSMRQVFVRKGNIWPSTDQLLGHYNGVDGLKTGYTSDAGYCYVGTAMQNGVRLISVVMGDTKNNDTQRFVDTAKLFDYGFQQFKEQQIVAKGAPLSQTLYVQNGRHQRLTVVVPAGLVVDVPGGMTGSLALSTKSLTAPVKTGQRVGSLEYVVNGHPIVQTDVTAAADDPAASFITRWARGLGQWFSNLLHHL